MKTVPGVKMTSGVRSPEKNAEVGGQPDSYHLASRGGVARDFVPPPGMSMSQLHSTLKRTFGPGWDVINEGDHVHIEPGPRMAARGQGGAPAAARAPAALPPPMAPATVAATPADVGLPSRS